MATRAVGGDLVLSARPVTAEAFAPFGRTLAPGEHARLAGRGGVLVSLDSREAAPRRIQSLQRFADARRMLVALGDGTFLLVVAGRGPAPAGPAVAFRVPAGTGVVMEPGVWHAGPILLADGSVLEATEVPGLSDHVDRCSVADAFGAEALRLMTPDEVGAPGASLDLADERSLTIDRALAGRVALGCLAFDGLAIGESDEGLRAEGERLTGELRRQWGRDVAPLADAGPSADVAGLGPVRGLYRALGLDPSKTRPASEALLRRVLQGRPLYRVNDLVDALSLFSLKTLMPFGVYDRARIAAPVVLRLATRGEGYEGIGRGRVAAESKPVLVDRDGPFGGPTADALRTSVGHGTTRALVVLYLPASLEPASVEAILDAASAAVVAHCGGQESGRRVAR